MGFLFLISFAEIHGVFRCKFPRQVCKGNEASRNWKAYGRSIDLS